MKATPQKDHIRKVAKKVKPVVDTSVTRKPRTTGCETYRHLIQQYDWDATTALAIMRAESGCNPNAHNTANYDGSNDAGLFQINSVHCPRLISCDARFEPTANVQAAYAIYMGSGWSAWSAFNNGAYQKYL